MHHGDIGTFRVAFTLVILMEDRQTDLPGTGQGVAGFSCPRRINSWMNNIPNGLAKTSSILEEEVYLSDILCKTHAWTLTQALLVI